MILIVITTMTCALCMICLLFMIYLFLYILTRDHCRFFWRVPFRPTLSVEWLCPSHVLEKTCWCTSRGGQCRQYWNWLRAIAFGPLLLGDGCFFFFLFWLIFGGLGKCFSVVDRFDGVFTTYMMSESFFGEHSLDYYYNIRTHFLLSFSGDVNWQLALWVFEGD